MFTSTRNLFFLFLFRGQKSFRRFVGASVYCLHGSGVNKIAQLSYILYCRNVGICLPLHSCSVKMNIYIRRKGFSSVYTNGSLVLTNSTSPSSILFHFQSDNNN